jgi:hypothetical protein
MVARVEQRGLQFTTSDEAFKFQNQLVNPSTLNEWIKCAFNGNVLEVT